MLSDKVNMYMQEIRSEILVSRLTSLAAEAGGGAARVAADNRPRIRNDMCRICSFLCSTLHKHTAVVATYRACLTSLTYTACLTLLTYTACLTWLNYTACLTCLTAHAHLPHMQQWWRPTQPASHDWPTHKQPASHNWPTDVQPATHDWPTHAQPASHDWPTTRHAGFIQYK